MGIVGDIAGLFDRLPGVKKVATLTRDVDALRLRVEALEAEVARRPAPELCPMCQRPLRVVKVKPLASSEGGRPYGEERFQECPGNEIDCVYPGRSQKVHFGMVGPSPAVPR
jgi:hypothetical protein